MTKQTDKNLLSLREKGDINAVLIRLKETGVHVKRWKVSEVVNGKMLSDEQAPAILAALAEVVAERHRTEMQNVAQAQQKYEALISSQ
ncbi:hypothetical protein C7N43_38260 [Sphingobacteriales bacterium UPWRP_1]|nr:hypothetical protein C7N43_38260 [Sphingobacteriales bacterium UPWRP_1]